MKDKYDAKARELTAVINGGTFSSNEDFVEGCERIIAIALRSTADEERESLTFLLTWVREWISKMHKDISDEERGRIADDMCCDWMNTGIGASYNEKR